MKRIEAYKPYLEQLFGQITTEQLQDVFSVAETKSYEAGQYVFKEGDKENSLYIVLSGRLRVLRNDTNTIHTLGEIAAGEPVGELALFTKEPRTASVIAIRRSILLQIDEADYNSLIVKYPHFANTLTQFIIRRLRRNAFQQRMTAPPKNIAIIKLQPEYDISPWTDKIRQEITSNPEHIRVYVAADQNVDDPNQIFNEVEDRQGFNIFVCDDEHRAWATQCITYCDLVIVVTDFNALCNVYPIEKHLNIYSSEILKKKVYLMLLHPENASTPTNTAQWFEGRNLTLHIHVRKNNMYDIRRFCRIITNQANGLVLGGGGAKGFAHIGALRAMMKAGIEIDFVGGTSAGALFGTAITFADFVDHEIDSLCKLGVESNVTANDYHFPFISLMTGNKMRKLLHKMYGDTHLEDLWVTTFCISTNYSSASLAVHETGLIRKHVEASIAIPGVFPPVIIDKHLHVDGGVMDNLPIETMYQKPVSNIIAIALNQQSAHLVDLENIPSAWEMFVNKITKKRRLRLPGMSGLLINALTLNSVQKQAATKSQVSIYLEMDLRKFGFLNWKPWKKLIEKGYEQTEKYLADMPQETRFWEKN